MITPILENLVIQGLAKVMHKTLGQNGVCTISVPSNQSIVITKICVQPFTNPSFKDGFATTGGVGTVNAIDDFTRQCLKAFIDSGGGVSNPGPSSDNIIYQMLRRGLFQVELYSSDNNNTIFTYGCDYNFVNTGPHISLGESTDGMVMLLPSISERSTDCYSVHKNNVHVRLRFLNKSITDAGSFGFETLYDDYLGAVSSGVLRNTIPENRINADINSTNIYMNTAVFTASAAGKIGFAPFTIETSNSINATLASSDTITFPYVPQVGATPLAGESGEASFYSIIRGNGRANMLAYMQMFVPYINVEYVLINQKSDGETLVNASLYNRVTIL